MRGDNDWFKIISWMRGLTVMINWMRKGSCCYWRGCHHRVLLLLLLRLSWDRLFLLKHWLIVELLEVIGWMIRPAWISRIRIGEPRRTHVLIVMRMRRLLPGTQVRRCWIRWLSRRSCSIGEVLGVEEVFIICSTTRFNVANTTKVAPEELYKLLFLNLRK